MRGPGKWWLPALASGAALLVTAGIVVALQPPAGAPAGSGPSRPAPAGLDQLLVRDGDTVTASGMVVAAPGRPARFCAPAPVAAVGSAGPEQPPSCSLGVDLVGADLARLRDPKSLRGTRWGWAGITGRYAAGTVTVTSQGPPAADPYPTPVPLDPPPCPAPAGGWRPGPLDRAALTALSALVAARPSGYGEVAMSYPDGRSGAATEVALVTTTLDPTDAERELRTRFDGNLCVQPAVRSRAAVDAVSSRLLPSGGAGHDAALRAYQKHQALQSGPDYLSGRVRVSLVVLDQAAFTWLRGVDAGTGIIDARPWLRPAAGCESDDRRCGVAEQLDVAWADEVVRDGDRVAGRGSVVALPGRPVQFCAPYATILVYPPPVPAPCRVAVTVTGLDLDRLTQRQERDGAVWGNASIEGVYRAGTLTVTAQDDHPVDRVTDAVADPDRIPCPEPPGGWPRQPADTERLVGALDAAVQAHPETYNGPWVRHPYGWHLQDTSNGKGTEVYLVGTTGDVEAARRELAEVFPAQHLCVTRVRWSKAAMEAATRQLSGPDAEAAGISAGHGLILDDSVVAELVVLDKTASRFLAGVADGRVVPQPVLHKLP